jgi:4-cresol dehydrogenase (hydroxylating)
LQKQRLTRALRGKAEWVVFLDKSLGNLEEAFPSSRFREVRSVVAGFTGAVGATGLPAAYWRMRRPPAALPDIDLDRDGCGFKFWTATTPFRGRDARRLATLATEIVLRHGLEPSIGILPVRERALQFHIACAYDREIDGADKRVMACHAELGTRLMDCGYYPTRLGAGFMHALERCEPPYGRLVRALKLAIDPKNIFAPGRYQTPPE